MIKDIKNLEQSIANSIERLQDISNKYLCSDKSDLKVFSVHYYVEMTTLQILIKALHNFKNSDKL